MGVALNVLVFAFANLWRVLICLIPWFVGAELIHDSFYTSSLTVGISTHWKTWLDTIWEAATKLLEQHLMTHYMQQGLKALSKLMLFFDVPSSKQLVNKELHSNNVPFWFGWCGTLLSQCCMHVYVRSLSVVGRPAECVVFNTKGLRTLLLKRLT